MDKNTPLQDFSAHSILIEKLLPKTYEINSRPNPSHKDLMAVLDNVQSIIAAAQAWESHTLSEIERIKQRDNIMSTILPQRHEPS